MTASALPPPPPPPPRPTHPPPRSGSEWKDTDRPPHAPFSPESRWGLGDAFTSFGIFLVTSIALVGIAILVDADPLEGFWFPLILAGPQIAQGAFTVGVGWAQGAGLDRDFGFKFKWIDLLLGFALLILGFIAAGGMAALMEQLGVETPEASVAELIDDAADAEIDDGSADGADAERGGATDGEDDIAADGEDGGVTVWIVIVAVFAATAVPVIEELIYRGLWWSALLKRGVPEGWTLVITSLAFAAAHFELQRFPVLFVLGLALGIGRFLTGRIGAAIVAHAMINGIAMAVLLATV